MTNLDGLITLAELGGDLYITGNPALPTCEAARFADRFISAGWTGELVISGNDDNGACD